jgi:hypothetical protein
VCVGVCVCVCVCARACMHFGRANRRAALRRVAGMCGIKRLTYLLNSQLRDCSHILWVNFLCCLVYSAVASSVEADAEASVYTPDARLARARAFHAKKRAHLAEVAAIRAEAASQAPPTQPGKLVTTTFVAKKPSIHIIRGERAYKAVKAAGGVKRLSWRKRAAYHKTMTGTPQEFM